MKKILAAVISFTVFMGTFAGAAGADGENPFTVTIEGTKVTVSLAEGSEYSETSFNVDLEKYGIDENAKIENLIIGDGIEGIYLQSPAVIENAYIPSTLETITEDNVSDFHVDENNQNFKDIDGVLFSKDGKTLMRFGTARKDDVYKIPEGTETAAWRAFTGAKIKEAILPGGLKTIENEAFSECKNLKNVNLPEGLEMLGGLAFENCVSLDCEIKLPKSLETMDFSPFGHCDSLKEVSIDEKNGYFTVENGVIYNKNKTRLISALASLEGVFELPKITVTIGRYAFEGSKVEEVIMHDGLKTIEAMAFYDCPNLKRMDIPSKTDVGFEFIADCRNLDEVVIRQDSLSARSIERCDIKKLVITSYTLELSFTGPFKAMGTSVTNYGIFTDTNIGAIYAPSGSAAERGARTILFYPIEMLDMTERQKTAVEAEGGNIFVNLDTGTVIYCDKGVKSAVIPKTVDGVEITAIGEKAFAGHTGLEKVEGEGIKNIGNEAFSGCTFLVEANLPNVEEIGERAFAYSEIKKLDFPKLKTVKAYAFINSYLTEINAPEVVVLEERAFSGSRIEKADMPLVEKVGKEAFMACTNIKDVSLPSARTVGEKAFSYCRELEKASLPQLEELGDNAFFNCGKIRDIEIPEDNLYFKTEDGMLLNKSGDELIRYFSGWGTSFELPEKITKITPGAFSGNCDLEMVEIKNGAEIPEDAFSHCKALKKADISSVATIGPGAFEYCGSLEEVNMDEAVTIGESAFSHCAALEKAHMPKAGSIGEGAFASCAALEKADAPEAAEIGARAFCYCSSLKEVYAPNAEILGSYAFQECAALENAVFENVRTVGVQAFESCKALKNVSLPNAEIISNFALSGCAALENISLPKVKTIGNFALYDCAALSEITLPSVEEIDEYAFYSCKNIKSVKLSKSLKKVETGAFRDCKALGDVYYEGSYLDRRNITLEEDNKNLVSAVWHYYAEN